jgi:glycosyltransferase involved in cell wall biosynthesis
MSLSKKLKAKLIFNVSDLWPESAEKLGLVTNKQMLRMAYRLEARCYKKSTLITGQTQGIVSDIKRRFPDKMVHWLPNGANIDNFNLEQIPSVDFRKKLGIPQQNVLLFYGGILGHAQGLEVILNAADQVRNKPVSFVIMGSGPEKTKLLNLAESLKLSNVYFPDPVGRTEITSVLKEIDVALVPLKKLDLFNGAIPSKIFESLAMCKPVLLGVDGEARSLFIDQGKAGWFFEPENVQDLVRTILLICDDHQLIREAGLRGREYIKKHFDRHKIADDFIKILETLIT